MTFLKSPYILAIVVFASACTYTRQQQCRDWQSEGDFYASMDACTKCVAQLGDNKEAVKGCALGLDASRLMGGMR